MEIYAFEGAGKTRFPLVGAPLDMMIANLDRPLTQAHLGILSRERAEHIFFRNMRQGMDALTQLEAIMIKEQIEQALLQNLEWLKGGTFLLDGGTLFRDVLKLSDPTIGGKVAAGQKFNPKDKASINAYMANLMSWIQDKGINFVITGHAAFSWEMIATMNDAGEMKKQLARTKTVYPKLDDIIAERANIALLLFKRCACGLNITTQDGTCTAQADAMSTDPKFQIQHQGRRHMARIVTNKFQSFTEGTVWENLDWKTLMVLSFDEKKAKLLIETGLN